MLTTTIVRGITPEALFLKADILEQHGADLLAKGEADDQTREQAGRLANSALHLRVAARLLTEADYI